MAAPLVARVRSTLRIKELHDTVLEQAKRLALQAEELKQWNETLNQRVNDQELWAKVGDGMKG
jgi:hypothetical protein